jgi:hypothetical protein
MRSVTFIMIAVMLIATFLSTIGSSIASPAPIKNIAVSVEQIRLMARSPNIRTPLCDGNIAGYNPIYAIWSVNGRKSPVVYFNCYNDLPGRPRTQIGVMLPVNCFQDLQDRFIPKISNSIRAANINCNQKLRPKKLDNDNYDWNEIGLDQVDCYSEFFNIGTDFYELYLIQFDNRPEKKWYIHRPQIPAYSIRTKIVRCSVHVYAIQNRSGSVDFLFAGLNDLVSVPDSRLMKMINDCGSLASTTNILIVSKCRFQYIAKKSSQSIEVGSRCPGNDSTERCSHEEYRRFESNLTREYRAALKIKE